MSSGSSRIRLSPERLATFLAHHRHTHAARLQGYEARAGADGTLDTYALATLDFGIRYERGVLDWLDQLSPELRGGTPV